MFLQNFPSELNKFQNFDENNSHCDESLLTDLENWNNSHPDSPGFYECLIEAREEVKNFVIPPWSNKKDSQEYIWKYCSDLEAVLRYITEFKIEVK